jgi:hypothetical protein
MKYIIYKIQIKDYIYIGSTQNFTIRKAHHKRDCNYESQHNHNYLLYRTIRENGGWDCCTMIPIKEIDVETKIQAHIAEEEVRVEYNAQMNSRRAHQTVEERKEYNKKLQQTPKYKEYRKQYLLAKKTKLVESPEIKVEA